MLNGGGLLEVKLFARNVNPRNVKGNKVKKGVYVCLMVSDTGHGMDKQTKERIFEPFFTSKEVGTGSGLGLSVVHGIVNNNGGFIEVESKKGKGTTFYIYLPQHSASPVTVKSQTVTKNRGSGCILFVDDEKEITYMGKKMLETLGYEVDIRTDGVTALNEIRKQPDKYDLLVTDQSMPKMLGTELIAQAREVRPDLKSIIITGYHEALPDDARSRLGISEIFMKPLILSDFSKHIHEVLSEKTVKNR
jgi:CheY-like chemotaxis protein